MAQHHSLSAAWFLDRSTRCFGKERRDGTDVDDKVLYRYTAMVGDLNAQRWLSARARSVLRRSVQKPVSSYQHSTRKPSCSFDVASSMRELSSMSNPLKDRRSTVAWQVSMAIFGSLSLQLQALEAIDTELQSAYRDGRGMSVLSRIKLDVHLHFQVPILNLILPNHAETGGRPQMAQKPYKSVTHIP